MDSCTNMAVYVLPVVPPPAANSVDINIPSFAAVDVVSEAAVGQLLFTVFVCWREDPALSTKHMPLSLACLYRWCHSILALPSKGTSRSVFQALRLCAADVNVVAVAKATWQDDGLQTSQCRLLCILHGMLLTTTERRRAFPALADLANCVHEMSTCGLAAALEADTSRVSTEIDGSLP